MGPVDFTLGVGGTGRAVLLWPYARPVSGRYNVRCHCGRYFDGRVAGFQHAATLPVQLDDFRMVRVTRDSRWIRDRLDEQRLPIRSVFDARRTPQHVAILRRSRDLGFSK